MDHCNIFTTFPASKSLHITVYSVHTQHPVSHTSSDTHRRKNQETGLQLLLCQQIHENLWEMIFVLSFTVKTKKGGGDAFSTFTELMYVKYLKYIQYEEHSTHALSSGFVLKI